MDKSGEIANSKIEQPSEVAPDMKEIEIQIAELEARKNRNRKRFIPLYLLSGVVFLVGLFIIFFPEAFGVWNFTDTNKFIPSAVGLFLLFYFYFAQTFLMDSSVQRQLDSLLIKKRIAERFKSADADSTSPSTTYFDSLVKINIDNLAEYYSLIKVHTDNSFKSSLAAGGIGFILIIIGLIAGFSSNLQTISFISTGAGVIVEFIASIFFYLYNKTVRQLKTYHDRLLEVQNILLSFKIVGDIQDEKEKVRMMGKMLAFLMKKEPQVLADDDDDNPKVNPVK